MDAKGYGIANHNIVGTVVLKNLCPISCLHFVKVLTKIVN